jgi:thiamine biosynthesis lipoprotein
LQRCEQLRRETDGYFDIRIPLLPPGVEATPRALASAPLDPTAYVRGWAAHLVAQKLDAAGVRNYRIRAGSSLRLRGSGTPGSLWRSDLRHPLQPDRIVACVVSDCLALATSEVEPWGTSVVDPHTGLPPSGILSVTVAGPDLGPASAYAIAIHAMGERGAAWISRRVRSGYEVMILLEDGTLASTPGFPAM